MHVALAEALDHADTLMARDERRRRLDGPFAASGVDVGVAQATRLDANEHLGGTRLWDRQVLDRQGLIEAADDGGLHGTTSAFSGLWQDLATKVAAPARGSIGAFPPDGP
jgi:hypothetical protein